MKSCKFNGNTLDVQIVQNRRKIQWNSMKNCTLDVYIKSTHWICRKNYIHLIG